MYNSTSMRSWFQVYFCNKQKHLNDIDISANLPVDIFSIYFLQPFFHCYKVLDGLFFSSPGPKVQVNYCHHLASVVCCLSSVNFSHFKLLLRKPIGTNLSRNVPWMVLYKVTVFRSNNML